MRFGARLNEAQYWGMPLTSVAGGSRKAGSFPARPRSCGPGSDSAFGLVTLTAPSAGSSGLPKVAARAVAPDNAMPAAAAVRMLRLESIALLLSNAAQLLPIAVFA